MGERSPGPGVYEKKSFLEDHSKKSFTLGQKREHKNALQTIPGPG